MAESAIDTGGPSLEQLLWRAMDRYAERPGLVDADEFADRFIGVFEGDLPAEEWVARFFEGDKLHSAPADIAEAIVRTSRERLHVYEFDLKRLEYVIVEDEEKVVVVSDFGQFALRNDDTVSRAIESAVIPAAPSRSEGGKEPRAYFVRSSGEVVAVDVKKVARSLEQLMVKQVSLSAVGRPQARLAPFAPVRSQLSEAREEKALRQDPRARQQLAVPPRLAKAIEARRAAEAAPPSSARTALFLLMPDGTLAKPSIGSATRWQQMVGSTAAASGPSVAVTGGQRFSVQNDNVVALIQPRASHAVGSAGARALASSEAISAVRGNSMPVRVLGDADLEQALSRGAMIVPGLASRDDRFWVQPERAFRAESRTYSDVPSNPAVAAPKPLQLGEITGDPWADWALTGGGEGAPEALAALRGRTRFALRAALDRPDDDGSMSSLPDLANQLRGIGGQQLQLAGAPVIGFRAPDGSVILNRPTGAIRLAGLDRAVLAPIDLQLPMGDAGGSGGAPVSIQTGIGDAPFALPGTSLASRSGALPDSALSALQFALERTAMAGSYKLPLGKLESAGDALDAGSALDASLGAGDLRRSSVRLAGPISMSQGAPGQVAQLVLSMPFPHGGELHVGDDLSQALQSYLTVPMQPAFAASAAGPGIGSSLALGGAQGALEGGSVLLRLRGGQMAQPSSADVAPIDWSGLHLQASQQARDAVVTLDLPDVQPLMSQSSTVSGLPFLLRQAIGNNGDWTPGPGAPMPTSIRNLAMAGPFDAQFAPELVDAAQVRPLNPGEEEIVIPMPLWAQMGRGQLSETNQIMASPLAPFGYAPQLGTYRLMAPGGAPIDMTGGAPSGTPGIIELAGPTGLDLQARLTGSPVVASSLGGRRIIGRVALDDGQSVVGSQGRLPIAGPMDLAAPAAATNAAQLASDADSASALSTGSSAQPGGSSALSNGSDAASDLSSSDSMPAQSRSVPSPSVRSQGGTAPSSAPTLVSGAPASSATSGTFVDGSFNDGMRDASTAGSAPSSASSSSMSTPALRSALQMSNDVGARTAAPSSFGASSASTPSMVSSSAQGGVDSSTFVTDSAGTGSPSLPTAGGSDQALVSSPSSPSIATDSSGNPISTDTSTSSSSGPPSTDTQVSQPSPYTPSQAVTGLQPGMWSGARRGSSGYQPWSFASSRPDTSQTAGGVSLSSLARPVYPSLPTSLRFRYVGAPLWWSSATPGIGSGATDAAADDADQGSPASRAMRSGLRAASSAASLWRSILVASPQWGGGAADEVSGIDAGHDASADQMSSLSRRFDSLSAASLVTAGATAGAVSGPAYIAMSSSGSAGPLTGSAAVRAKADSVEMRIVAAIPPSPPPLESMGSGATGGNAPHARGKGASQSDGHGDKKEASDAVSASKIEGSVDAIAQRIYHRIRSRIQSDRERFGG